MQSLASKLFDRQFLRFEQQSRGAAMHLQTRYLCCEQLKITLFQQSLSY